MWSKVEIVKSYIRDANEAVADEAFDELLTEFSGQPTLPKEIYQIVDMYAMAGKYDKADQIYQHVLNNWPEARQEGFGHIGVAEINLLDLIDSGNYADAQKALDILIADFNEHPDLAWTLDGIAGRYEKVEKYAEARGIYQKIAADFNETDYALTALKKLAILEITVGDDIAAQEALDTLIADFNNHPNLPESIFIIAEKYFYKQHYKKAIELWKYMYTTYPQNDFNSEIPFFLATCYEQMDDWRTAIQHYKETLEKYPNSRHANRAAHRIGLLYRFAGEYENALIWLRKQRELYSNKLNSQRALFEQGAVYFLDIKDYQKAIEVFQQYISEYPDDEHTWPAYRCLAKCYENTDNTPQAIAILQEALNKFSGSKYADAIKAKLDEIKEGGEK